MKNLLLSALLVLISLHCYSQTRVWEKTLQSNTIQGYKDFLLKYKYSESEYLDDAMIRLTELEFQKAEEIGTIDSYKYFLKNYGENTYSNQVKAQITKLEYEVVKNKNTIESYQEFISKNNESIYLDKAKIAIDSLRWEETLKVNTLESYWNYINLDDDVSKFISLAETKLEIIRKGSESLIVRVDVLKGIIDELILPFDLNEISKIASGDNKGTLLLPQGYAIHWSTEKKKVGEKECEIVLMMHVENGTIEALFFYLKEGKISPLDLYEGNIGNEILSLISNAEKSDANPIGFSKVSFKSSLIYDKEVSYLIIKGDAYPIK